MHFTPRPNRVPALIFTLLLIVLSILARVVAAREGLDDIVATALTIASNLIFALLLLFIPRYLLGFYHYLLLPADALGSTYKLTIARTIGKNRRLICKLPNVSGILAISKSTDAKKAAKAIGRRLLYHVELVPSIFPKETYALLINESEENGTCIALTLECSAEFIAEIRSRADLPESPF